MKDESGTCREDQLTASSFSPHPSALGTEAAVRPLTACQMHAINLLAMGKSVVSTARTLGIGESTLHRWKATHPLFKAELARRQHNLFDAMIGKLRLTMSKAVDQLFEMMTGDSKVDRKEVMREMLKLLKPQKYLVPSEPMTVEGVLDETVWEARASRGETVATEITDQDRLAAIPAEFRVIEKETETAPRTAERVPEVQNSPKAPIRDAEPSTAPGRTKTASSTGANDRGPSERDSVQIESREGERSELGARAGRGNGHPEVPRRIRPERASIDDRQGQVLRGSD